MSECASYPKCFGPYLLYAISTGFANFEFFNEEKKYRLFFLAEFEKPEGASGFKKKMEIAGFPVELFPADGKTRYVTVRTGRAAVLHPSAFCIWDEYVARVELSLPLKPAAASGDLPQRVNGRSSTKSLLIGVLDNGCPFAAARFLGTPKGADKTRMFAIWDQDDEKVPIEVKDNLGNPSLFGEVPKDFKYGVEFRRNPSGAALPQITLDKWIELHAAPTGIDEDGCYADAGFTPLKRRQSHGAHVMDLFAGSLPPSSRLPSADRRDPPSWKPGTDPACSPDVDIVFVQFPEKCIRDHTGVWLKAYVVDGVRYILSCADPNRSEHIVINLSYGPTTGPHDGTAELEAALAALVEEAKAGGHTLEIVLAAGNAYLSEGHVAFQRDQNQPDHVEWIWRLPPDNTVLCFAEVWMKKNQSSGVAVTLDSPTGATRPVLGPVDWDDNTMWLLEVEPTIAGPGVTADEHGDYKIKITGVGVGAEVHAYVARTDPNMGVRTGARASHFVDAPWERSRSAAAAHTRVDGEFDKVGSLVRCDGTLNGLATGQVEMDNQNGTKEVRVHVAGGYIIANGRGTTYSSAGPARAPSLREGPDFALPGDESCALGGMLAGGNRSGSVFRMIGTSTAAPQLARWLAKGRPLPPATNVPTDTPGKRKRGGGNIGPP